jgi:hypothetical protein
VHIYSDIEDEFQLISIHAKSNKEEKYMGSLMLFILNYIYCLKITSTYKDSTSTYDSIWYNYFLHLHLIKSCKISRNKS